MKPGNLVKYKWHAGVGWREQEIFIVVSEPYAARRAPGITPPVGYVIDIAGNYGGKEFKCFRIGVDALKIISQ